MTSDDNTHRTEHRPMFATWRRAMLTLLFMTISNSSFSQGTPEQRAACTPDVFRLCSAFIPNADEITICLRHKHAGLSDACRTVLDAGTKRTRDAGDDTGVRSRSLR